MICTRPSFYTYLFGKFSVRTEWMIPYYFATKQSSSFFKADHFYVDCAFLLSYNYANYKKEIFLLIEPFAQFVRIIDTFLQSQYSLFCENENSGA